MDSKQVYSLFHGMHEKFRGLVDTRVIGHSSFTLLFLKYITDCWKDAYHRYQQSYGDDLDLIKRKMSRERFILSKNASFDRIVTEKYNPDLGHLINRVLADVESMNRDTLNGIFDRIDFNSDYEFGDRRNRNQFLQELISRFEQLDLRPSNGNQMDLISACIERIGGLTEITNANGGEFFTPADISTLLARLMKPEPGEQAYDPLCGSGGLLIAVARELEEKNGDKIRNYAIYGQEKHKEISALAKMNIYLAGLDNIHLAEGNVIMEPAWNKGNSLMQFDIVVSHLPFSIPWEEQVAYHDPYNRFQWGIPPRSKGEYAFIQHIIASTKKSSGRMGIIVPLGILFRGGREASIREGIIKENLVEAVIALPSNLLPFSSIPCAILVLSKGRQQNENILFIDASRNFQPGKYRNSLREEDLAHILHSFSEFQKNPTGTGNGNREDFSRVVTPQEIAALGYNLNVSNYVHAKKEDTGEEVDVPFMKNRIAGLEKELATLRSSIQKYLQDLGL